MLVMNVCMGNRVFGPDYCFKEVYAVLHMHSYILYYVLPDTSDQLFPYYLAVHSVLFSSILYVFKITKNFHSEISD